MRETIPTSKNVFKLFTVHPNYHEKMLNKCFEKGVTVNKLKSFHHDFACCVRLGRSINVDHARHFDDAHNARRTLFTVHPANRAHYAHGAIFDVAPNARRTRSTSRSVRIMRTGDI